MQDSIVNVNWISKDALEYPFIFKGKKYREYELRDQFADREDGRETFKGIKTANFTVNLSYSKTQIKHLLDNYIRTFQFLSEAPENESHKKLYKYFDYLRIYDLKMKYPAWTYPQLSTKYDKDYKGAAATLERQMRAEHKRAEELIDGEYREIC